MFGGSAEHWKSAGNDGAGSDFPYTFGYMNPLQKIVFLRNLLNVQNQDVYMISLLGMALFRVTLGFDFSEWAHTYVFYGLF
jgi:hypothetical protein